MKTIVLLFAGFMLGLSAMVLWAVEPEMRRPYR